MPQISLISSQQTAVDDRLICMLDILAKTPAHHLPGAAGHGNTRFNELHLTRAIRSENVTMWQKLADSTIYRWIRAIEKAAWQLREESQYFNHVTIPLALNNLKVKGVLSLDDLALIRRQFLIVGRKLAGQSEESASESEQDLSEGDDEEVINSSYSGESNSSELHIPILESKFCSPEAVNEEFVTPKKFQQNGVIDEGMVCTPIDKYSQENIFSWLKSSEYNSKSSTLSHNDDSTNGKRRKLNHDHVQEAIDIFGSEFVVEDLMNPSDFSNLMSYRAKEYGNERTFIDSLLIEAAEEFITSSSFGSLRNASSLQTIAAATSE